MSDDNIKLNGVATVTIGIVVLIILFFIFCFRVVGVGQVGIVTRFGQVVREQGSGILIHWPWPIESLTKMNVQTQKEQENAAAATKDLQQLDTTVAVNYHLTPATASTVFKNIGTDYLDVVINPNIQESVKAETALYNASELVGQLAMV